jgi:hypothetical protein
MDKQPMEEEDWEFKARTLEVENEILTKRLDLGKETIADLEKTNADLTRVANDLSKHIFFLLGKLNAAGIKIEE